MPRTTVATLQRKKEAGEKIVALTSYDASFTHLAEQASVDILLVGDSLGMIIQGHTSTLPVTMDDMVYHTANVARASQQALLIGDLPFMSYGSPDQALQNAGRMMQAGGVQMVKLEGGAPLVPTVRYLTERGIPVCAHLGLLPQSINQLGGYRVQGREQAAAEQLIKDAEQMQAAGAQLLIVECIPRTLAATVSKRVRIPVIGIGAGPETDGQILVLYDMLGISLNKIPRFSHNFLADTGNIAEAIQAYAKAVRTQQFPTDQHSY